MTATDDSAAVVAPGRRQRGRRRPRLVTATAATAGFGGVTALGGGVEMLLFPHGNQFVPGAWLADVPLIDSWVLPGLVLGVGFGVGGIVTTYGLLRRPRWRALDRLQRRTGRHWSWLARSRWVRVSRGGCCSRWPSSRSGHRSRCCTPRSPPCWSRCRCSDRSAST